MNLTRYVLLPGCVANIVLCSYYPLFMMIPYLVFDLNICNSERPVKFCLAGFK